MKSNFTGSPYFVSTFMRKWPHFSAITYGVTNYTEENHFLNLFTNINSKSGCVEI